MKITVFILCLITSLFCLNRNSIGLLGPVIAQEKILNAFHFEEEIALEYIEKFTKRPQVQPLLILLAGYQGSGKSTLIKQTIKKGLGPFNEFNVISKDEIRFSLLEKGIAITDDFRKSVDTIFDHLLREALIRELNVIIDTNMHAKKLEEIEQFLEVENNYHLVYKVYLYAEKETLIKRVNRRQVTACCYLGTLEELEICFSIHQINGYDYDLIIDSENLDEFGVFEELRKSISQFALPLGFMAPN